MEVAMTRDELLVSATGGKRMPCLDRASCEMWDRARPRSRATPPISRRLVATRSTPLVPRARQDNAERAARRIVHYGLARRGAASRAQLHTPTDPSAS